MMEKSSKREPIRSTNTSYYNLCVIDDFLQELLDDGKLFARLMEEYGTASIEDELLPETGLAVPDDTEALKHAGGQGAVLMQVEERFTGAVTWSIYAEYMKYAGGARWVPILVLLLILAQGAQGRLSSYHRLRLLISAQWEITYSLAFGLRSQFKVHRKSLWGLISLN